MRILKENTAALIIDMQERLFPHIYQNQQLQKNCAILIKGLKLLEIPLLLTEQYSKGLGATIAPIQILLEENTPLEKMAFSCCGSEDFMKNLQAVNKKFVVICGIEAHVCVQQTVIDLLEKNYQPVVIADCISSRKEADKNIALERMRQAGAVITSYESILFELCRVAGTEQFKQISKLVK